MPRIDPLQLLNCLNVLLTPTGGIKSEQEVARISSLMEKFSKKLVSKCVYLLILKSSEAHLLSKFMGLGGWNMIFKWLVEAVEAKNYPFLIELLEVIIMCPVDIERLKSNSMPRQIKFLSKDLTVHEKVRDLASDIVKHWLAIVKGTTPPMIKNNMSTNETGVQNQQSTANHEIKREVNQNDASQTDNLSHDTPIEDEADATYVQSTSPSSSSVDTDDSDVYVPPNQKDNAKSKKRVVAKKEKSLLKKSNRETKPKLKSKLITSNDSKEAKPGSIKLKIEKRIEEVPVLKTKKEEKTLEEKLKEKRKLKDEKEKEKFARFKEHREKREKHKDKQDLDGKNKNKLQEQKLKGDLSKLLPKSLEKLGRIPKISKDSMSQDDKRKDDAKKNEKVEDKKLVKKDDKLVVVKTKENEKDKDATKKDKDIKRPAPVLPKKPVSMSVEKRFAAGEAKPKTVKAYNSKFRLTGLEQEVIPKPVSRKTSLSGSPTLNLASTVAEKTAVKRSPPKDVEIEPIEKKLKSPDLSFTEEKSPQANKAKKPFLQESDSFMNAMTVALQSQKDLLRKRKKPVSKTDADGKLDDGSNKKSSDVSSPVAKSESKETKPTFKFYKDTLESTTEENQDITADYKESNKQSPEESSTTFEEEEVKREKIVVTDPCKPVSAEGLKSSLSIFRVKKLPKKSVSWKDDTELEAIQFFEVDATERTNVVRNFWDMQMMERSKERESMLMARKSADDKMAVQTKWKPLILIDLPPPSTVRGANSQEKAVQYARERMVPPSIFFNKAMVPDTPAEPDLEIHPVTVPPIIPLDDISGSQDSINDFSNFKCPEPKQYPPEGADTNAMPNFMSNMPPPMFPPFPDGSFPPPFGPPFFSGNPVPPVPAPPANWTAGSNEQNQQQSTGMPWVPPPGMMAPFGMMGPPFPPIPGPGFPGPPNMFPAPGMTPPVNNENNNSGNNNSSSNTSSSDGQQQPQHPQFSNSNYSSPGYSENKKWNNDDRYFKKDGWRGNYDRGRDKRGSNWRGSGGNSRLCRTFQNKGFCNISGCRFYHPEK